MNPDPRPLLPTLPLRVPLLAALALGVLVALFSWLPAAAPAQDSHTDNKQQSGDSDGYDRPRPSREDRGDRRRVLVLRARGGDLSAVLADGLATNPSNRRALRVVRLDNDRRRDNADYVLEVSASHLPRGGVGAGGGSLVVVVTLQHPATGKVIGGQRHVFRTLDEAFDELGNLRAVIARLADQPAPPDTDPDPVPEPPDPVPDPDPQPHPPVRPPQWAENPESSAGCITLVGSVENTSDANRARDEARRNADSKLDELVRSAALDAVKTYFERRDRRNVRPTRFALQGTFDREQAAVAIVPPNADFQDVYVAVTAKIADTRAPFIRTAMRMARSVDPASSLDTDEFQTIYSEWLRARGYTVTDEEPAEPDQPPVELSNRRDLGAGWASMTATVTAADLATATQMARDRGLHAEAGEQIQQQWHKVQAHQQYGGALASYSSATVSRTVRNNDGTVTVTLQLRVAYRTFQQWAKRILGIR